MLITLPDNEWTWSDTDKGKWDVNIDEYQQFYGLWRDGSAGPNFLSLFPYKLSLGVDGKGASRILITKSYDDMYHRLMHLRQNDKGNAKGAVLTGQPAVRLSDPYPVRQLTSASLQEKLPS